MNYSAELFSFQFKDVDVILFDLLNISQIRSVQLLNRKTVSLFNDKKFWDDKIKQKFPKFIIPETTGNKYVDLYGILLRKDDIKLLEYAVKHDFVEIIEYMVKENKFIFTTGANLLARHGKLETLKQLRYTCPDGDGVLTAAENQQYHIVEWLMKEKRIIPCVTTLIIRGKFETVKYFYQSNEKWIQEIAKHKSTIITYHRLDILKMLAGNNILPTVNDMNIAASNGSMEIIEWGALYEVFPDCNGYNLALINNHHEVISWLKEKNVGPSNFCFTELIWRDRYDNLKEFISGNILPTEDHLELAIMINRPKIVKLFLDNGSTVNAFDINRLIFVKDNLSLLKLFVERGYMSSDHANLAVALNKIETFKLFKAYNILPNLEKIPHNYVDIYVVGSFIKKLKNMGALPINHEDTEFFIAY